MGIAQSLLSAWSSAVEPSSSTRFLKISIESEQAVLALEVAQQASSAKDDFALIEQKGNISPTEACYILHKLDKGKGWLFITYVPDGAKVREKMLYSSSKSRLTKALSEAHFTDSLHATSPSDLTPRGYAQHLAANAAPHPLTDRERALAEVRAAEEIEAKEEGMRGTAGRGGPMGQMGVGGGLTWGDGVEDALKGLSGKNGEVVGLSIDPKTPTLLLLSVPPTTTTLADLHTHLPPTSPQYTFFSFTPPKASATPIVIFVYTCPSKSPIRMRMVYSSSVASLIRAVGEKAGVQVAKKIESSEPHTLTSSEILSELGNGPFPTPSTNATPSASRQSSLNVAAPSQPVRSLSGGSASSAPSPVADARTTTTAPLDAPTREGFAKPKGPPRRAAGGRVAAASKAWESGQAGSGSEA